MWYSFPNEAIDKTKNKIVYKNTKEEIKMYIFNKITVNPQLPKSIEKLGEISENLWWSWNTEFLKIFKEIDIDLWEKVDKNPVKFLKLISQEKLEQAAINETILFYNWNFPFKIHPTSF